MVAILFQPQCVVMTSGVGSHPAVIDCFTVSLHSSNGRQMPAIRAEQGDCERPLNSGNSHRSCEPTKHCDWGNPNLYLDQPITKEWCQPIGLKRYAEPTIRYDTRYSAHDTIRSAIHFNTLPLLVEKQRLVMRACDQEHCTPHARYWLRSNDAQ